MTIHETTRTTTTTTTTTTTRTTPPTTTRRDETEARLGRRSDVETVRREKIHVRRKGREVGKYCVFRNFADTSGTTSVLISDLSIEI